MVVDCSMAWVAAAKCCLGVVVTLLMESLWIVVCCRFGSVEEEGRRALNTCSVLKSVTDNFLIVILLFWAQ